MGKLEGIIVLAIFWITVGVLLSGAISVSDSALELMQDSNGTLNITKGLQAPLPEPTNSSTNSSELEIIEPSPIIPTPTIPIDNASVSPSPFVEPIINATPSITPIASPNPIPSMIPNPSPSIEVSPSPSPIPCVPEACDGLDNDCNGIADDGFLCGQGFFCSLGACQRDGPERSIMAVESAAALDLGAYSSKKTIIFYAGGKPVAQKESTVLRYLHDDALGSIIFKTDSSGTLITSSTAAYDAYGYSKANDPKFTGKSKDSSTGLIYFGARYYDPNVGRFTSADSLGGNIAMPQTLNRYAYVSNNPTFYTDPDGRQQSGVFISNGQIYRKSDSSIVASRDSALTALNDQTPDPKHPWVIEESGEGRFFTWSQIMSQGKGPNNEFIIPEYGATRFAGGVSIPSGNQILGGGERILGREVMAYSISMDPAGFLGKRYSSFAKSVRGKNLDEMAILKKLAEFIYTSPANKPLYNLENEVARTKALASRGVADLGEALFSRSIDGKNFGFGATCRPMALAAGAFLEQLCGEGILKGTIESEISSHHAYVVFRNNQGKRFKVDPSLPLVNQLSN